MSWYWWLVIGTVIYCVYIFWAVSKTKKKDKPSDKIYPLH